MKGSVITISNQKTQTDRSPISDIFRQLRSIAVCELARMYRLQEQLFAFTLRKSGNKEILEGINRRYTATALIGLAGKAQGVQEDYF